MATVVIVGNRDAALEAALQLGHEVVLISDRKVQKRRKTMLAGVVQADLNATNAREFTARCVAAMRNIDAALPSRINAVVGVIERAVLPAAWLRAHLHLTGNPPQSVYLCRNKLAMKRKLQAAGVSCADFVPVTGRTTASGLVQRLGLPLVIKPVDSSGARGAAVARQQSEVEAALRPGMLAERFVHGIEMSVESFIHAGEVTFVNLTEYLVPLWSNIVPATVSDVLRAQLLALNTRVIKALGIRRGMTHMEVFLTPTTPLFSEIAVRPPGGCLMDLMKNVYGFDPWHAFFETELGLTPHFDPAPKQSAGVVFLHPGEGRVKRVAGVARAQQVPGVVEASCRVSANDTLSRREGSGESVAHIVATGKTRADVVRTLELARRSLVVELHPTSPERRSSKQVKAGRGVARRSA